MRARAEEARAEAGNFLGLLGLFNPLHQAAAFVLTKTYVRTFIEPSSLERLQHAKFSILLIFLIFLYFRGT
jgi:hypothetical protein